MSFYKSIATVGGLTLVSRLFGFARDILTATFLGAGPLADAFFVALKLPNFFRRITAEGAFSVSFVPLFAAELEENGKDAAVKFAEEAQAFMLAVLVPFTIVVIAAMPWVLMLIAPGFSDTPERYDAALELSRITFPYILLMSLTSLMGGVMNSFDRFGPFAAAPILFNFSLIVGMVCFTDMAGSAGHAMAWAVSVAGLLQLIWLTVACRRMGVRLHWRIPKLTPRLRVLFRKMGPGIFGAGVAQINLLVDMIIASLLPVGAISFLYYADRLYQLPLSVIGIAVGTAILPMLTRALRGADKATANHLFGQGFEICLILALPAAAAYLVIAPEIMDVLFARGEFSVEESRQSAYALMGYALGLPAFVLAKVLAAVFFAHHDTATPVKYAVICAVMNTVLALTFSQMLAADGFGHVGIALATGLTAWVNAILLLRGLKRFGDISLHKKTAQRLLMILLATIGMAAVLWLATCAALPLVQASGDIVQLLVLLAVMGLAGLCYGGLLLALRVVHMGQLKALFAKVKKTDTIKPDVSAE